MKLIGVMLSVISNFLLSYYSDAYFPVDGQGYVSEGQTDCNGVLNNF